MYYSKITSNISKVNYIYWNNSIYIDENIKSIETNEQLIHEIEENTWMVGKESIPIIMDETESCVLWKHALGRLGEKYKIWSHFPQIPAMN